MGNLLREAARADTPLGQKVCSLFRSGQLAPDELIYELIEARLSLLKDDNILFDGTPATINQAHWVLNADDCW